MLGWAKECIKATVQGHLTLGLGKLRLAQLTEVNRVVHGHEPDGSGNWDLRAATLPDQRSFRLPAEFGGRCQRLAGGVHLRSADRAARSQLPEPSAARNVEWTLARVEDTFKFDTTSELL
jgi:hypothetical protein